MNYNKIKREIKGNSRANHLTRRFTKKWDRVRIIDLLEAYRDGKEPISNEIELDYDKVITLEHIHKGVYVKMLYIKENYTILYYEDYLGNYWDLDMKIEFPYYNVGLAIVEQHDIRYSNDTGPR
tara:strand:+ start:3876 stop:4247 length:372 start_codon:yes stop_codon:yes gene_type:complete